MVAQLYSTKHLRGYVNHTVTPTATLDVCVCVCVYLCVYVCIRLHSENDPPVRGGISAPCQVILQQEEFLLYIK